MSTLVESHQNPRLVVFLMFSVFLCVMSRTLIFLCLSNSYFSVLELLCFAVIEFAFVQLGVGAYQVHHDV